MECRQNGCIHEHGSQIIYWAGRMIACHIYSYLFKFGRLICDLCLNKLLSFEKVVRKNVYEVLVELLHRSWDFKIDTNYVADG